MNLDQRIDALVSLGDLFRKLNGEQSKLKFSPEEQAVVDAFSMQIKRAHENNGWFTEDNVYYAFQSWGELLCRSELEQWVSNYVIDDQKPAKVVGIIMAGNIPLVGFHDFIAALLTGHNVVVKLSSNDPYFVPLASKYLEQLNPYFIGRITFTNERLENFDAVIATGSNNTARYFEHYFGNYPNIIRKNRNAIAIISGNESKEELELLGEDIFRYFGLGCRSVSKIYVPENYDFDKLFAALYRFHNIINYKKYENNYDYNKAVYLMSLFPILENGFLMLKEDSSFSSPIATLFYEYYKSKEELHTQLNAQQDNIQCIVSNDNVDEFVNFGSSQQPKLWNYADGIDTIEFLLKI